MKIYTGNFANVKKYREKGLTTISIALSARNFSGVVYNILSPEWAYKNDPEDSYEQKFNKKLNSLSAKVIYGDLEKISNGKDIILLCHESEGEFCHRRLVAQWFEKELLIKVEELGRMEKTKKEVIQTNMFAV